MEKLTMRNDKELKEISSYLNMMMDSEAAATAYSDMEEMKNLMADGFCHFTFRKVNGEIRDAYGTRAADIIEEYEGSRTRKGGGAGSAFNGTFAYFDIVKRAWRCFRIDTLIELDRAYVQ